MKARVQNLTAELAARRADARKSEFELNRIERLSKLGRSADKEQIDADSNHSAAQARVRQAEAMLAESQALLAVAQDNLERTVTNAPFDGAITNKLTELGQWLDVGSPVAELVDLSVVRARINVPESAIPFCKIGDDATVTVDALGRDFAGKVSRIIPDADKQANTFPVEIDIDNIDGLCKPGMFIRAMVPSGPATIRLLIPKDAVISRGPTNIVYVARPAEKGHVAEIAPVTVVAEVMRFVAVESPALRPGDLAIVRGNESLRGPGPVVIASDGSEKPGPGKDGGLAKSPANLEPGDDSAASDAHAGIRDDSRS
jgi:RND family efflux transporter MFP subunit